MRAPRSLLWPSLLAAFLSLAGTGTARAEDAPVPRLTVASRAIAGASPVVIDPARAYLLIRSARPQIFNFLAEPTAEDMARWRDLRTAAFVAAQEDAAREQRRGRRVDRDAPPPPDEANFPWPDIRTGLVVSIGPLPPFASTSEGYLYLTELPAGTYTFYGTGRLAGGTCACLGSVQFRLERGVVTAVRIEAAWLDPHGQLLMRQPAGYSLLDLEARAALVVEPALPASTDPRLPTDLQAVDLVPMAELPNWFGGAVNRVMPVLGVLGYERDRLVDLRPPVPSPMTLPDPAPVAEAAEEASPGDAVPAGATS